MSHENPHSLRVLISHENPRTPPSEIGQVPKGKKTNPLRTDVLFEGATKGKSRKKAVFFLEITLPF